MVSTRERGQEQAGELSDGHAGRLLWKEMGKDRGRDREAHDSHVP